MPFSGYSKESTDPAQTDSGNYKAGDPLCFIGDVLDGSSIKLVKLELFNRQDPANPVLS